MEISYIPLEHPGFLEPFPCHGFSFIMCHHKAPVLRFISGFELPTVSLRGRREAAMLVDRERRADKKKVSQVRGAKQDAPKRESPLCHILDYGSAPDHTRPKAVDRVGTHALE